MEKGRTEAFSDGVFAIAITLLVLEFRVPESENPTNRELAHALVRLWPSMLAFLGSFVAILVMWINHHRLFVLLRHMSRGMLFANGFLLMLVTFLPFPTAVVARNINCGGATASAVFYCGTYIFINIAFHLLLTAAVRGGLFRDDVSQGQVAKIRSAYWMGSAVYIVATAIAFVQPLTAVIGSSLLWIFWARMRYYEPG